MDEGGGLLLMFFRLIYFAIGSLQIRKGQHEGVMAFREKITYVLEEDANVKAAEGE